MKRLDLILFVTIILGLGLVGCGDKLTRGKAKDIIIKQVGYPQRISEKIYLSHRINIDSKKGAQQMSSLISKGLIVKKGKFFRYINYRAVVVSLTEKAKEYIVSNKISSKTKYNYVKVATKKFDKIMGIRSLNDNTALVEYTWYYDNLTPFGENWYIFESAKMTLFPAKNNPYNTKIRHKKEVMLQLYDDGWRLMR